MQIEETQENTTKIIEDCVLYISDDLEFHDLLAAAKINETCHDLATTVFKRKFSMKTVSIKYKKPVKKSKISNIMQKMKRGGAKRGAPLEPAYSVNENTIEISNDFEMIADTLKYFGKHIQKLQMIRSKEIIELVNEHCWESLLEFRLTFKGGNINALKYVTKPFERVERVFIEGDGNMPKTASDILPMNQIFPALRNLSVVLDGWDNGFLYCHFPHLEHVYLNILLTYIKPMLELNPQIKSIEWDRFQGMDAFVQLTKLFPHLEHLTSDWMGLSPEYAKPIYFNNLKKLTMTRAFASTPTGFKYPSLQEFEVYDLNEWHVDEYIRFLQEHNQLRRFHLGYWNITDEEFEALTVEQTNLVEMTLERTRDVRFIGVNSIIKFIENHAHLMKFNVDACSADDYETIHQVFEDKWTIKDRVKGISMERIN